MIFVLAVLCFVTAPTTLGEKIHEEMNAEDVKRIFQSTHESVPDYEVVQFDVSRLVKRGSRAKRALRLKAFGDDIKLWVQPAEGILVGKNTPVSIARNDDGQIVYDDYINGMANVGTLLEDPERKASLIVGKDSQGLYSINGYIESTNLVIRSLPQSISDDLMNRSPQNSSSSRNSKTTRSVYHVVFKRGTKRIKERNESVRFNETMTRLSRAVKPKSSIPDVVYPEIMVVVDSTYIPINEGNIDRILAYVVTFWNGVDLRYRSFEGPKFRFNIARVIIAKDQDAVPYISESLVNPTIIDAFEAKRGAQYYYYQVLDKFSEYSYDAVVTMTRLDMGDGGEDPDILGIAPIGGACVVDDENSQVMNVAIVTDTGSFDGVSTAVHEFAHLIGARHDEEARGCRPEDGNVMTTHSEMTEHSHEFSTCSVADIQRFLALKRGYCLYNDPMTKDPLPRILPGEFRDRDYQCKMLKRGKSCYSEAKKHVQCAAIYCEDPEDSRICSSVNVYAPADGAFCSTGKVCLHGKCVAV